MPEPPPSPEPYERTRRSCTFVAIGLRSWIAAAPAAPLTTAKLSSVERERLRAR